MAKNINEKRARDMVKVGEAKSIRAAKRKLRKMTEGEWVTYFLDTVEPKLYEQISRR